MKQYLWKSKERLPFAPLLFVVAVFFAASSLGAVLNPFPSPERVPIYQQVVPRVRQPQPDSELEQFKHDLQNFSCADIAALSKKLQQQVNAATTIASRNYFNGFINALRAEKEKKCTK